MTIRLPAATGSTFSSFDPGKFHKSELYGASEIEALLRRCAGLRAKLDN